MDEGLRDAVRERAGRCCEYCRLPEAFSQQVFEVDHVIAQKHDGKTILSNLVWSCFACNHHKGSNVAGVCPLTKSIVKLFHPRRHKWERHFRWRGGVLIGMTSIGRATIAVLAINLPYRVALREALIQEGISFELE